jgi:hypothetical protein
MKKIEADLWIWFGSFYNPGDNCIDDRLDIEQIQHEISPIMGVIVIEWGDNPAQFLNVQKLLCFIIHFWPVNLPFKNLRIKTGKHIYLTD